MQVTKLIALPDYLEHVVYYGTKVADIRVIVGVVGCYCQRDGSISEQ